jgi:gamma-glutamyltranspeptidase/glutathione hydrolase
MPRLAVAGPNTSVTDAARLAGEMGGSVADVAIVASQGEVFYRTVSMEYGGGVTTLVDVGSVAVPGSFAALAETSNRFGLLPWIQLLEIVASAIERGFPMSPTAHLYFQDSAVPIFSQDPASKLALFEGDSLKAIGETVHYEGLAETLRYIGEEGVEVFYKGDLGAAVVDDLSARGGLLTRQDLAEYEAVARRPLEIPLANWKLATNPPPAVGGVTMATALALMDKAEDSLNGAVWAESLRSAFRTRLDRLEPAEDLEEETHSLLLELGMRSPSTISVSAVDNTGAAAAASFSAGYGAGVVPKGTGLLMNNCLGEIELTPGGMEAQIPGQRLLSNMAPTIARSPNQALAVGSPGADRITSALAISIGRVVFGGDELAAAIEYPRVHPEFVEAGDRIAAERGVDLSDIRMPVRWFDEHHMYFGGVNGAALLHGELAAHADSRRTGAVALID